MRFNYSYPYMNGTRLMVARPFGSRFRMLFGWPLHCHHHKATYPRHHPFELKSDRSKRKPKRIV